MIKKDYIFILWSPVIGDEETVGFIQLASTVYLEAAVIGSEEILALFILWLPVIGNEVIDLLFMVARNRQRRNSIAYLFYGHP